MASILVTGGSGLVGSALCEKLKNKGHEVSILSRKAFDSEYKVYVWDIENQTIDPQAIDDNEIIIHLAGANIGDKKWSPARKKLIIDSRILSTELLFKAVNKSTSSITSFISASAIGYYGAISSDHIFEETDSPASDFLGAVCKEWEDAVDQFETLNIRTVKLRTGVVLSGTGGALKKMITPVKHGFGAALGSGKQYIPWIHIDDLCEMYVEAVEHTNLQGVYNAVAPHHITNRDFTQSLALILKKPFFLPKVPSLVIRMIFGEMSDIILKGSRVSSEKIQNTGFECQYKKVGDALGDLLT